MVKSLDIAENNILQNIDNVKNIITSTFKEVIKEGKFSATKKLRYYKEVINSNLDNWKYLSVVTSSWNKINIAKIRMNSHALHSEQGIGLFLKLHGQKGFVICVSL